MTILSEEDWSCTLISARLGVVWEDATKDLLLRSDGPIPTPSHKSTPDQNRTSRVKKITNVPTPSQLPKTAARGSEAGLSSSGRTRISHLQVLRDRKCNSHARARNQIFIVFISCLFRGPGRPVDSGPAGLPVGTGGYEPQAKPKVKAGPRGRPGRARTTPAAAGAAGLRLRRRRVRRAAPARAAQAAGGLRMSRRARPARSPDRRSPACSSPVRGRRGSAYE